MRARVLVGAVSVGLIVVAGCSERPSQPAPAQGPTRMERVVARQMRALTAPLARVRIEAAETLAQIGPAAEDAIPDLMLALIDSDDQVKASAAGALGQIGTASPEVLASLESLTSYGTEFVRNSARVALFKLGAGELGESVAAGAFRLRR